MKKSRTTYQALQVGNEFVSVGSLIKLQNGKTARVQKINKDRSVLAFYECGERSETVVFENIKPL